MVRRTQEHVGRTGYKEARGEPDFSRDRSPGTTDCRIDAAANRCTAVKPLKVRVLLEHAPRDRSEARLSSVEARELQSRGVCDPWIRVFTNERPAVRRLVIPQHVTLGIVLHQDLLIVNRPFSFFGKVQPELAFPRPRIAVCPRRHGYFDVAIVPKILSLFQLRPACSERGAGAYGSASRDVTALNTSAAISSLARSPSSTTQCAAAACAR